MNAVVSNAMADQQNAEIERTVRTERARFFNFIRKRVRHEDDAEDILQDVLWQFIEAYRRLETIERVTSWLFQVARNKIADSYRKKSPVQTVALCWFSVKMTARLDVNATPGVRMSPLAPGIVPECSGASRVKRAARAGFAALDSPCALWYSLVVGERERSGAPGIRVFMRAPCYYAAHAAPLVPAPVSGPAPTRSLGPCQP